VHDAITTRIDGDSNRGRNADVDEVATTANSKKEAHFIDINNIRNNKLSSISIGNRHKLVTDGHIERISRNGMRNVFCIVEASHVILEHPEHQKVEHKIGNGDSATASMLVTIQRGSVNNGLDD
jgi:fructose-1-phosphate kinase PfkB-like protein